MELRESISNISHDLRTPLTVIASYINLIERSDKSMSNKTHSYLEIIKKRIVGNILNNAVKYTDGDLKVMLDEAEKITFCNTAKMLDTVAVGKLFNRFFTVEDGESSTKQVAMRTKQSKSIDVLAFLCKMCYSII